MAIYLGLDLGTTVLKITAIDDEGTIVANINKEIQITSPQPDWAEEQPAVWWSTFQELLKKISHQIDLNDVKGIGLSGQMHGLVTYDKDYNVLRPAIIWADKRSTEQVEQTIKEVGIPTTYKITGNPVFTGFLLPSLMWIKKNEPDLYNKIYKVSSPKDYVCYKLTGNLMSEPTDALATSAFDYKKNEWSKEMIQSAGIKQSLFPEIKPTSTPYGGITKEVAKKTGLPEGTLVFGGSDQSMAAIGCGLVEEGQVMVALSTGGQCLIIAEKGLLDKKRRLHTLNHAKDGIGMYMAATLAAGLSLKWFKAQIIKEMDTTYSTFVHGIEEIPMGSEGLYFLPFLTGERTPYFNPHLKGSFIGLSLGHHRMHMARAIMEGVSYSIRECIQVFREMNMPIKQVILSGGGTRNSTWRQILTDIINIPTTTINIDEHSPYGAAIYAKFAQEGLEKLPAFYKKVIKTGVKIKPIASHVKKYDEYFQEYSHLASYFDKYTAKK